MKCENKLIKFTLVSLLQFGITNCSQVTFTPSKSNKPSSSPSLSTESGSIPQSSQATQAVPADASNQSSSISAENQSASVTPIVPSSQSISTGSIPPQPPAINCPAGLQITFHDQNYPFGNLNHGTCQIVTPAGVFNAIAGVVLVSGLNQTNSHNLAGVGIQCGNDGKWYGFTSSNGILCQNVGILQGTMYNCVPLVHGQDYDLGYAGCDGNHF